MLYILISRSSVTRAQFTIKLNGQDVGCAILWCHDSVFNDVRGYRSAAILLWYSFQGNILMCTGSFNSLKFNPTFRHDFLFMMPVGLNWSRPLVFDKNEMINEASHEASLLRFSCRNEPEGNRALVVVDCVCWFGELLDSRELLTMYCFILFIDSIWCD